jgi:hypothetical protein
MPSGSPGGAESVCEQLVTARCRRAARASTVASSVRPMRQCRVDGAEIFLCARQAADWQNAEMDSEPRDMCRWTLAASESGFLREFSDEPRNWYTRDPEGLRQLLPNHADRILADDPPNSNDFLLHDCLCTVGERSPADYLHQIQSVFVVKTMDLEVNAEAWISDGPAHLIAVYAAAATDALIAYAVLLRRTHQFLLDLSSGPIQNALELWDRAREGIPDLLGDPLVSVVVSERDRWRSEGSIQLTQRALNAVSAYTEPLVDDRSPIDILVEKGLEFIVAHETSHHVLGHTFPAQWGPCTFPARGT